MQSQSRWKLRTTCRHGPPPGATIATTQTKPGEPRKNQHSGTRRQRRWQSTTRRRRRTSELQTACLACYGLCVASHHCHHCVIVIVIVPHAEPWAIWVSIQLPDDAGDASAVHVLQCSSTVLEHCNTVTHAAGSTCHRGGYYARATQQTFWGMDGAKVTCARFMPQKVSTMSTASPE